MYALRCLQLIPVQGPKLGHNETESRRYAIFIAIMNPTGLFLELALRRDSRFF